MKPRRVGDHLRLVTVPAQSARPAVNLDAEIATIASAIEDRRALTLALSMGLRDEHFHSESNAFVWQALVQMSATVDKPIHVVAVAQWLQDRGWPAPENGWPDYLVRQSHMTAPIADVVALVIELADVRAIQAEAQTIVNEAGAPIADRKAWIANAPERIRARLSVVGRASEEPAQILPRVLEEINSGGGKLLGYATGIKGIDQKIGGLVPAELLLLTGREKEGKSALGSQLAASVARTPGLASMILQWEDPSDKTMARLVGARARVDLAKLRMGTWDEYDAQAFALAADKFARLPLKIEADCRPDVASIAAKIRAAQDDFAARDLVLAAVVVDSLQVLEGEGQNREQQIENAIKALNVLKRAKDLQRVAWIVINHTGADGEMANARMAPRRWCNTWLHLEVGSKEKEGYDGARPAHLALKLARDIEAGGEIPLWCHRACNNLFLDGSDR